MQEKIQPGHSLTPTHDPDVFIEIEELGRVLYRHRDGRRWEVIGSCDYRGHCIQGAVNAPMGPRELRLDVPVGPGFKDCCPLTIRVLDPGKAAA